MSRLDDQIAAAIKADPRAHEERQIIYWTGEAMFAEGKTEEQIEICIRDQTEAEVRLRMIATDIEIKVRAADKARLRARNEWLIASIVATLVIGALARVNPIVMFTEWSIQATIACLGILILGGAFLGYILPPFLRLVAGDLFAAFKTEPPAPFIIEDEFGNEALFTPNGRGDGKVTLLD